MKRLEGNTRRIIVAGLLVLIIAAAFLLWPARTPVAEPVPSPNGYDDFLKAAALLSPRTTFELRDLPEGKLREVVTQNSDALKALRSAFERECRVPVEYSTTYLDKHFPELPKHKALGYALAAEGRVAELDQRTNDAARCYVDAIRLGHEMARGGMTIDHLVGVACEWMGSSRLARIVPALDGPECRLAIANMEAIESKRESPEETLRIERAWVRMKGMKERIGLMISWRSFDPAKQSHGKYLIRLNAEIARQAQLRIDLANRAYELENGHPPSDLQVLVPGYLKSLPKLPITATNPPSIPP